MPFRIEVREAEKVPRFYGAAYRDWPKDVTVCYPVPFHRIVFRFREWWYGYRFSHVLATNQMLHKQDVVDLIHELRLLRREVTYLAYRTDDIEELYEYGIIRCPIE